MPELEEKAVNYSAASVTLVTSTETVIISSGPVKVPRATCLVHIRAWCLLGSGVGTATVAPFIRRGTTTAGLQVGGGGAEALKTAAGSTEPFVMEATEQRQAMDTVEYSFTLAQGGATGNGTVYKACIEVEILGG